MLRTLLVALLVAAGSFGIATALGMNPSTPTDLLLNLGGVERDAALDAELPGTLVVLQHGLWRSAASLGRLERTLRAQGYEVFNESYPSTSGTIEEHARALDAALRAELASRATPPARIAFVGHSLGGLVIRAYLALPGAVEPYAVVFIGTPQRGATLAAARRDLWFFDLLMGRHAARQLAPDDPFFATLQPLRVERVGVLFGAKGDGEGWNPDVPGDDDGTVGVAEVRCESATDTIGLRIGHTRISFARASIRQVLAFLRHGRFEH